jgi:hypothetical protein
VNVRTRLTLVAVTVVAVLAAIGVYIGTHVFTGNPIIPRSEYCTATAGTAVVTLDIDQMADAATISAVGIRRGMPARAVQVALATAMQESKLTNLTGGDRDSLGLFQQRPSQGWGTRKQISDPRYSAGRFYGALTHVKGWQKMTVTQAAQAVQRSAHPDAYQKWAVWAGTLSSALLGDSSHAVDCYVGTVPLARGPTAIGALATDLKGDWGSLARLMTNVDPDTLALSVADTQSGWQYAHWLEGRPLDPGRRPGDTGPRRDRGRAGLRDLISWPRPPRT